MKKILQIVANSGCLESRNSLTKRAVVGKNSSIRIFAIETFRDSYNVLRRNSRRPYNENLVATFFFLPRKVFNRCCIFDDCIVVCCMAVYKSSLTYYCEMFVARTNKEISRLRAYLSSTSFCFVLFK